MESDNPTPEAAMVERYVTDRERLEAVATAGQLVLANDMRNRLIDLGHTDIADRRALLLDLVVNVFAPPPVAGGEGASREALVERLAVSFSDKVILRLDIDEDDRRLSLIVDEMRAEIEAALATPATGGTFADGVEAAAKVADHHAQHAANLMKDGDESITDLRVCFQITAERIAAAIRALQPGAGREDQSRAVVLERLLRSVPLHRLEPDQRVAIRTALAPGEKS